MEAEVSTENGCFRGAVPSGASTGANEAKELRDGGARHGPLLPIPVIRLHDTICTAPVRFQQSSALSNS